MTTRGNQHSRSKEIDETVVQRRLESWQQTPATRLAGVADAPAAIDRFGVVTLFPASPEIPNLFHAYMGDPEAAVDSKHDSPSGQVYSWRWTLGGQNVAFYATVVRNRPTFISWSLLPAILRLRGELRSPEELYRAGELSTNARRIAETLATAGGTLSTGELRKEAGFPTGKEQRNAYLKALAELDRCLLVAKVFTAGSTDMSHALVASHYTQQRAEAERLSRQAAMNQLLEVYLSHAVYVVPKILARHLGLVEAELRAALDERLTSGTLVEAEMSGQRGRCYVRLPVESIS